MMIVDFIKEPNLESWNVVDDSVMGGKSVGKMAVDEEGNGLFEGYVLLDNNGGFTSINHYAGNIKLKDYNKFVLVLKGDGKAFQFRIKTESTHYYSYIFSFETTGNWQTLEIPFSSMKASFRGQSLDMANFPGEYLAEIGFLIGNKKKEDFKLEIKNISVE